MEKPPSGSKRRLLFSPQKSPAAKRPATRKTPRKLTAVQAGKRQLMEAIRHSNYDTAVRHMLTENSATRDALFRVLSSTIKNELMEYSKQRNMFTDLLSLDKLSTFSWRGLTDECEKNLSVVSEVLRCMFPCPSTIASRQPKGAKGKKRNMSDEETNNLLSARIGTVLAIIITRSPHKNKFIQSCLGVELWRQGSSAKVFQTLNYLGISQGVAAARAHVDQLGEHHDADIFQWKEAMEDVFGPRTTDKEGVASGYSVTWDNVQTTSKAKHQDSTQGNKFLIWGMCFATQNRVATAKCSGGELKKLARKLPPFAYLPSPEDYLSLRKRMETLVTRLLATHMECLQECVIPQHIKHPYAKEMTQRTNMASIGVVSANPSSTEGVTKIMKHLHQYVPQDGQGNAVPVLANGDNLSVERMRSARRGAVNGLSPEGRLEGLLECPQEFHKEALLLQDFMNNFLKQRSMVSRGTLYHMKVHFGHKSLKTKVSENFKHAWEMMEFATVGHVLLLALRRCDVKGLKDIPAGFPSDSTRKEKLAWVEHLAKEVVQTCWYPVDQKHIIKAAEAFLAHEEDSKADLNSYPFCHCNTEKDDAFVRCCSSLCVKQWYHQSCIQVPPLNNAEDWYCSYECKADDGYVYCICHQKKADAEMVQCLLEGNCRRLEWYHTDCIGKTVDEVEGDWYCCEECELGAGEDDYVLNHSKALLWEGLNLLVRREAVREGDGPSIMAHWKHDLLQFWSRNHYKYFASACQLLAGASGVYGERIKEDLIWNRTANVTGGAGSNIGLDLLNEFVNNDFKEMLKLCHGMYTEKQVERVVKMSGAFGKHLDKLFTEAGLGQLESRSYDRKSAWFETDLVKMVGEFQTDALFDYCPVREHKGYEQFAADRSLRSPEKMGIKIAEFTSDLDFWEELSEDLRRCN